ncbi:hypothetical protein HZA56_19615 [Candidatus Poribacteria bacterium]|nr:hypothetical protein [Candidatus Poribacteria bacterium]
MWLFRFGVPLLAIIGFGHAVYEVFTDKIDVGKMGLTRPTLRMFGVGNLVMTVCWIFIFFGLWMGDEWPRFLATFITGMFLFDYLVSLPLYKNIGDNFFKYWAGTAVILQIIYCIWL